MAPTYLIVSDNLIRETQIPFAWADALAALWTGDYDGTPRLLAMNIEVGKIEDCTNAALTELADRAEHEGETPRHLEVLFDAAGLAYPTERMPRRPVPCAGMGRLVMAGVR